MFVIDEWDGTAVGSLHCQVQRQAEFIVNRGGDVSGFVFPADNLTGYGIGGELEDSVTNTDLEFDDASTFGIIFNLQAERHTQYELIYSNQSTQLDTSTLFVNEPILDIDVHHLQLGGTYLAAKPDGSLWVGATQEEAGFHQQVTAEGTAGLLTAAIRVVPDLREATLLRAWSGLRPGSPDGMPILGPVG